MTHKEIEQMIEYPKDGILSKAIVKDDKIDMTLFCMAKGAELSEHTSTKSGFVHVVDGNGLFVLEGKNIQMKPGVIILMDKDAVHSLSAKENTSFILGLYR